MTIYHTFLDDSTVSGLETIQGIQNNGSEFLALSLRNW